jgi:hypothetical protein
VDQEVEEETAVDESDGWHPDGGQQWDLLGKLIAKSFIGLRLSLPLQCCVFDLL